MSLRRQQQPKWHSPSGSPGVAAPHTWEAVSGMVLGTPETRPAHPPSLGLCSTAFSANSFLLFPELWTMTSRPTWKRYSASSPSSARPKEQGSQRPPAGGRRGPQCHTVLARPLSHPQNGHAGWQDCSGSPGPSVPVCGRWHLSPAHRGLRDGAHGHCQPCPGPRPS